MIEICSDAMFPDIYCTLQLFNNMETPLSVWEIMVSPFFLRLTEHLYTLADIMFGVNHLFLWSIFHCKLSVYCRVNMVNHQKNNNIDKPIKINIYIDIYIYTVYGGLLKWMYLKIDGF